jgi:hypothetical protein
MAFHTTNRAVSNVKMGEKNRRSGQKEVIYRRFLWLWVKEASIVRQSLAEGDLHFQDWI